MGITRVNDFGYVDKFQRAGSFDGDLSAVNPYVINTALTRPMNIPGRHRSPSVGMEMSESPPRESTSSKQPYSVIGELNPYMIPQETGVQYEDLTVVRNYHANHSRTKEKRSGESKENILYGATKAANNSGIKKGNPLYESKSFPQKQSKQPSLEEGNDCNHENSNHCLIIFTILIGLLATASLTIVFLLVFGIIQLDCKAGNEIISGSKSPLTTERKYEAQFNTTSVSLTLLQNFIKHNISNEVKRLKAELKTQKNKNHALQIELEKQKQVTERLNKAGLNNSKEAHALREQYQQHKSMVQKLEAELNRQKQATGQLNITISKITLVPGPQGVAGPPGLNGTQGPPGPPGLNLSSCEFKTNNLGRVTANLAKVYTDPGETLASQNKQILAATCSMYNFHFTKLEYEKETKKQRYKCTCFNRINSTVDAACFINFWECRNV